MARARHSDPPGKEPSHLALATRRPDRGRTCVPRLGGGGGGGRGRRAPLVLAPRDLHRRGPPRTRGPGADPAPAARDRGSRGPRRGKRRAPRLRAARRLRGLRDVAQRDGRHVGKGSGTDRTAARGGALGQLPGRLLGAPAQPPPLPTAGRDPVPSRTTSRPRGRATAPRRAARPIRSSTRWPTTPMRTTSWRTSSRRDT